MNVDEPWQRTRVISYFTLKPHDTKDTLKELKDVFSLSSDKKVKKKAMAIIRDMTEEEKKIYKELIPDG